MLPLGTLKLTSRRTTWSSKAKLTLSNTTADNTAGACEVTSPTDRALGTIGSLEITSRVI